MADELFVDQNEVEGTASGAWSRMLAGNRRFAEGKPEHPNRGAEARAALVDTHAPEAAVLSCSDARVSPDIIFDSVLATCSRFARPVKSSTKPCLHPWNTR